MESNKTFSHEEAIEASLEYFKGDELAARVWVNKYAMKDSFGNIYEKSPADMHWRIANEIARIDRHWQQSPDSFVEQLLCDRTRRRCRLLRCHNAH